MRVLTKILNAISPVISAKARRLVKKYVPKRFHDTLMHFARTRQPRTAKLRLCLPDGPETPSPFTFAFAAENPLTYLGEKYQPTKRLHNYLVYYWAHLRDIRNDVRSVLEIGVQTDRSLRMWEEFFPNAEIIGIDIDPNCRMFEGGRRRIFIGDQSDHSFLGTVASRAAFPFDVVIDDGSHLVEHQVSSFNFLFPRMSDHGVYVIEDTGGCVEDFGLATVNAIKPLIDSVMFWPQRFPVLEWGRLGEFAADVAWPHRHIVGVAFYRWMIVVMRGVNPGDNPFLDKAAPGAG